MNSLLNSLLCIMLVRVSLPDICLNVIKTLMFTESNTWMS